MTPPASAWRPVTTLGALLAAIGLVAVLGMAGSRPLAAFGEGWRSWWGLAALPVAATLSVVGLVLALRAAEDPWRLPWARALGVELALVAFLALAALSGGPPTPSDGNPGGRIGWAMAQLSTQATGSVATAFLAWMAALVVGAVLALKIGATEIRGWLAYAGQLGQGSDDDETNGGASAASRAPARHPDRSAPGRRAHPYLPGSAPAGTRDAPRHAPPGSPRREEPRSGPAAYRSEDARSGWPAASPPSLHETNVPLDEPIEAEPDFGDIDFDIDDAFDAGGATAPPTQPPSRSWSPPGPTRSSPSPRQPGPKPALPTAPVTKPPAYAPSARYRERLQREGGAAARGGAAKPGRDQPPASTSNAPRSDDPRANPPPPRPAPHRPPSRPASPLSSPREPASPRASTPTPAPSPPLSPEEALYREARALARSYQSSVSAALLQRKLRLTYPQAKHLYDRLVADGIVLDLPADDRVDDYDAGDWDADQDR